MTLRTCSLILIGLGLLTSHLCCNAPVKKIYYSKISNFKALYYQPDHFTKENPGIAIVYIPEKLLYTVGIKKIKKMGYDLDAFIEVFKEWETAVFIPLNKVNLFYSIKKALDYCQNKPEISKIYIIAEKEQGFLSVIAGSKLSKISGYVLVNPISIHKLGPLSLRGLKKKLPRINVPILYFLSFRYDSSTVYKTKQLLNLLKRNHQLIYLYRLDKKNEWFWDTTHSFMEEIYYFIFDNEKPEPEKGSKIYDYTS